MSFGHHDASLAVIEDDVIVHASHAERYSRIKNDPLLHPEQIREALLYGIPEKIIYYENPWLKRKRQLISGEWSGIFQGSHKRVKKTLGEIDQGLLRAEWINGHHHRSHAAAGFYTSDYEDALVITCDAIGEMETLTVFEARKGKLSNSPLYHLEYPDSVGLFYSAITKAVGLKPNEEEFILMGMSAFGEPVYLPQIDDWITIAPAPDGFPLWRSSKEFHFGIDLGDLSQEEKMNWAASAQAKIENYILSVFKYLQDHHPENKNWVFMGGVALNCVLNSRLAQALPHGSSLHIFPSPGDSGSSLGAILGYTNEKVVFNSPYLGTELPVYDDPEKVVELLLRDGIIGMVQSRAEFGPRALGNRSLLADPRTEAMKSKLNQFKKREEFRPFAPVIIKELAQDYFEFPGVVTESPYMQYVMNVKRPELMPAIVHVDGTARVQTLSKMTNPLLYRVLELWYQKTGCPVLINTSLNIKGEPLINTVSQAIKFEQQYGIKVLFSTK